MVAAKLQRLLECRTADDEARKAAQAQDMRRRYFGSRFDAALFVVEDDDGNVVELHCSYDPDTRSGTGTSDRKVKGTIHWVSAKHAVPATVRLIDRLFTVEDPHAADGELEDQLNPDAIEELMDCQLEPSLRGQKVGYQCQFERLGYFCIDPDTKEDGLVINRTIGLRDSWAKQAGKR